MCIQKTYFLYIETLVSQADAILVLTLPLLRGCACTEVFATRCDSSASVRIVIGSCLGPMSLFCISKTAFMRSNMPAGAFLYLKNSISEQSHAARGFVVPQQ